MAVGRLRTSRESRVPATTSRSSSHQTLVATYPGKTSLYLFLTTTTMEINNLRHLSRQQNKILIYQLISRPLRPLRFLRCQTFLSQRIWWTWQRPTWSSKEARRWTWQCRCSDCNQILRHSSPLRCRTMHSVINSLLWGYPANRTLSMRTCYRISSITSQIQIMPHNSFNLTSRWTQQMYRLQLILLLFSSSSRHQQSVAQSHPSLKS